MPLTKAQLMERLSRVQNRMREANTLYDKNDLITRWQRDRATIDDGSRFQVDVSYFDKSIGESPSQVAVGAGLHMLLANHQMAPELLQLGEAIRLGVVEALDAQIAALIEERDQMLCDILGEPMPSEDERNLRGVRIR